MTEPLRPCGPPAAPPAELVPVLISLEPAPGIPAPVGQIAVQCLSKFDGAALALAAVPSPAHPAIRGLVLAKAGLEVGQCVAETVKSAERDAAIKRALEQCVEMGGTPVGVVNDQLGCLVSVEREP